MNSSISFWFWGVEFLAQSFLLLVFVKEGVVFWSSDSDELPVRLTESLMCESMVKRNVEMTIRQKPLEMDSRRGSSPLCDDTV